MHVVSLLGNQTVPNSSSPLRAVANGLFLPTCGPGSAPVPLALPLLAVVRWGQSGEEDENLHRCSSHSPAQLLEGAHRGFLNIRDKLMGPEPV